MSSEDGSESSSFDSQEPHFGSSQASLSVAFDEGTLSLNPSEPWTSETKDKDLEESAPSVPEIECFGHCVQYTHTVDCRCPDQVCKHKGGEVSSQHGRSPSRAETWGIDDVRRHWVLKDHCEVLYFPCQEASLGLPTKLGRFLWDLHRASGQPSPHHLKTIARCALGTLRDLNLYEGEKLTQIILCDNLLDVNWLDYCNRKKFIDGLEAFIRTQTELTMVSFENSRMKRSEGKRLLFALALACGATVSRLYLWQMFARDENPVLKDTTFCKYRDRGAFKGSSTCRMSFWKAMMRFPALTVLAVNYSYLADTKGHTLLMLSSVLSGSLKELQLLCLEDEIPNNHNCNDFDGLFGIPDRIWRDARVYCPGLAVYMVFIAIPKYEDIMAFLTPSIPVRHVYLSSGIDLLFQYPYSVDRTLQILELWYRDTLEVLCLHLWRNREDIDKAIIDAVANFPRLETLEFSGILYKENTIKEICEKIRHGSCLKKLKLMIQETYSSEDVECGVFTTDAAELRSSFQDIEDKYKDHFKDRDIHLELGTYPF